METGTYILYKDACNLKSNQQNLGGPVSSLYLIIEYSSPKKLLFVIASITLSKCVNEETKGLTPSIK